MHEDVTIARIEHLIATVPHLPDQLQTDWTALKQAIQNLRQNPHNQKRRNALLSASERIWQSTNDGVYAVQHASEDKLGLFRVIDWILLLNTLLVLAALLLIKLLVRDRMEKRATYDALTGAVNRSVMEQRAPALLDEARPLCCLMLDLDHFKQINDTHGHKAGDSVLKEFAAIIRGHIRKGDLFVRYGGEEFVLLLSSLNQEEARALAERICQTVARHPFTIVGHTTVSVGLACALEGDTPHTLIARADGQLYRAKEAGRNRVAG